MPPTIAELFASPDHYMHAFEGDAAVFVTMDRAAYRRSIFLDARIAPAIPEPIRVPLTPLVKANVPVNFILPEVSAADSAAPAIFLYLGLRDYCLAILRSAPHRAWLRQVCGLLGSHLDRFDPASDGERAAALWLAQVGRFAAALEAMPHARSLDGERLLEHPAQTVTAAASALDLPLTPGAIAAVRAGGLFATYSKRPGIAFDNAARLARRREDEASLAGDIATAQAWLAAHRATATAALAVIETRALG